MPYKRVRVATKPRGIFGKIRYIFKKVWVKEEDAQPKEGFVYGQPPKKGTVAHALIKHMEEMLGEEKGKEKEKEKEKRKPGRPKKSWADIEMERRKKK